jgi:acyl-CoA thioesterase FadM
VCSWFHLARDPEKLIWHAVTEYAYTASMTTTFLKPVTLPGVVLVRSRVVKVEGRKLWVRGCIEDSDGESHPSETGYCMSSAA